MPGTKIIIKGDDVVNFALHINGEIITYLKESGLKNMIYTILSFFKKV